MLKRIGRSLKALRDGLVQSPHLANEEIEANLQLHGRFNGTARINQNHLVLSPVLFFLFFFILCCDPLHDTSERGSHKTCTQDSQHF